MRRQKSAYELALEKLEKAARDAKRGRTPSPTRSSFPRRFGQLPRLKRFHTPVTRRRRAEEFLRQMQSDANTPLLAAHRDLLRQFLEACDLVKFAHYQPDRGELEQVQERAVEAFVTAGDDGRMEGAPA